MSAAQLWDKLLEAMNTRDIAVANAAKRIEREFVGIIEMRRQAYMAAVEREAGK